MPWDSGELLGAMAEKFLQPAARGVGAVVKAAAGTAGDLVVHLTKIDAARRLRLNWALVPLRIDFHVFDGSLSNKI
jgi:hypothetical protein